MNKTVLITGAARRIGKGIIQQFSKMGWNSVIHYNNSETEAEQLKLACEREYGVSITLAKADLRHEHDVKLMFDKLKAKISPPELLINNAAIFPEPTNFGQVTHKEWLNTQNSNLNSVFLMSTEYVNWADRGRIINFASLGAHEVWAGRSHYHAAKAGVLHLTRAMGKDLAPNFSVNSISPGVIDIPEDQNDDKSIAFESRIPMGRFGNTNDIFDAVYFFATASKYITCQDLQVDGGWHHTR